MFIKKGNKFINALPLWKKGMHPFQPFGNVATGGGGGNPFPSVTGLILHLDAGLDVSTNISNEVIDWLDQSGNNNDGYDPFSSRRPILTASNANLNSLPSVDFGNDDVINVDDSVTMDNVGNGLTLYVVFSYVSDNNSFPHLISHTNGSTWTEGWGVYIRDNQLQFYVNNWNSPSQRVGVTYSSPVVNGKSILKCVYDRTNLYIELMGDNAGSATKAYTAAINTTIYPFQLCYGGSTSWDINANIAEVIYADSTMTAAQRTNVENYLKTKFNVT